jgi:hypothetical protein
MIKIAPPIHKFREIKTLNGYDESPGPVFLEYPPCRRTIRFQLYDRHGDGHGNPPQGPIGDLRKFSLWVPYQLYYSYGHKRYILFSAEPIKTGQEIVYSACLPNIFGDDSVCCGGNDFDKIDRFIDYFWNSIFYELKYCFWDGTKILRAMFECGPLLPTPGTNFTLWGPHHDEPYERWQKAELNEVIERMKATKIDSFSRYTPASFVNYCISRGFKFKS